MNIQAIPKVFNRAFLLIFSKKKILLVFLTLLIASLFVTFFNAIGWSAHPWLSQSLGFLSFFITIGILFSLGVFLIKVYKEEVKGNSLSLREILKNAWPLLVGASYVSIPVILTYLFIWVLVGVFLGLEKIPFFGAFFAFAPFLLNVASLLLAFGSVLALFFVAPWVAFCGLNHEDLIYDVSERVKKDILGNIFYFFLSLVPFLFSVTFLGLAFVLTEALFSENEAVLLEQAVRQFLILVPFSFLISFSVIFFFQFAAEAYVVSKKSIS